MIGFGIDFYIRIFSERVQNEDPGMCVVTFVLQLHRSVLMSHRRYCCNSSLLFAAGIGILIISYIELAHTTLLHSQQSACVLILIKIYDFSKHNARGGLQRSSPSAAHTQDVDGAATHRPS